MRLLLRPHAALLAHLGGVGAQRRRDRRTELGGLNEKRRKGPNLINTGAIGHSPKRVFVAATGPKLQHHGAELLRSTKLPVKLIAASIGFASRSHFSRAFASAYGADPSRFRSERAQGSSL